MKSEENNEPYPIDPLIEQMNSVLQLMPQLSRGRQPDRQRRSSDADIPLAGPNTTENDTVSTQRIAVGSRNGSRWLPGPDSQSRKVCKGPSIFKPGNPDTLTATEITPHSCNGAQCAVIQTFETTELLELILAYLETDDVLRLRSTSRRWNYISKESPHLRLHFFGRPQYARPAADYALLPLALPGLTIERGDPLHLGQWIHVSLTRGAARRIALATKMRCRVRSRSVFEGIRGGLGRAESPQNLFWSRSAPVLGSSPTLHYSDLFVTQPPLLGMQAFIISPETPSASHSDVGDDGVSNSLNTGPTACAKLSCDTGVTMGFLAKSAQSLLASAEGARCGGEEDDRLVLFKAIMSFAPGPQKPRKRENAQNVTRIG